MINKFSNLQISDNALIGNRFNGHDLHFYLRQQKIQSSQLIFNLDMIDDNDTYFLPEIEHKKVCLVN